MDVMRRITVCEPPESISVLIGFDTAAWTAVPRKSPAPGQRVVVHCCDMTSQTPSHDPESASTSNDAAATRSTPIRSVCVYCASSDGSNQLVIDEAVALGRLLATEGIELVFGGGAVGLMGRIASEVMDAGGTVTGIIPMPLMPKEVANREITTLIEVDTMHERKALMIERSDAFIAMPGGFGTLEELAEVLTWAQLGIHQKPIGLLNVDGFYDQLLGFFDRCIADQVLKVKNRDLLIDRAEAKPLLDALLRYQPSFEPKWIDPAKTF